MVNNEEDISIVIDHLNNKYTTNYDKPGIFEKSMYTLGFGRS